MNNTSGSPLIIFTLAVSAVTLAMPLTVLAAKGSNGGGGNGGGGASCSITTVPSPPIIDVAQSVSFSGGVSGKGPAAYSWTFEGGAPESSTASSVSVNYSVAGTYGATLNGINGKGQSCSAAVSVTVKEASVNHPPTAQPDFFVADEDSPITGNVLADNDSGADSDPDGNDISVTAYDAVSTLGAGVTIDAAGNLSYDPTLSASLQALDDDQSVEDSFTYTITDDADQPLSDTAMARVTVTGITDAPGDALSINSSSRNTAMPPAAPVSEIPRDVTPGYEGQYQVLAINDLGMHCGDLDTRISSILPPFNVLHAQIVRRGSTPRLIGPENGVSVVYSAASNVSDPALASKPVVAKDGHSLYKTNFWDIAFQAYDPFYPDGILELFYDQSTAANNVDIGLPVPDVERFYLEDGELHAAQQAMPGWDSPYMLNTPQSFEEHIGTLPFFTGLPFGYTAEVNWFEAAGVPIAVFDDVGRENPYPLMRVQAMAGGNILASQDTVMPISGEAECQACHAAAVDGGNGRGIQSLIDADIEVMVSIQDPAVDVPGAASVEWASDINILRLHDLKHGTTLDQGFDEQTGESNEPVVCQRCHYTPALDLAQLGPLGPENDFSADFMNSAVPGGVIHSPSVANGRDQLKHKSMSNVMHSHHGQFTDLFPDMPPAISGNVKRDPLITRQVLEETCYRCHPGRKTQCMRGAMANGGLVCQDCHGNMAQVGDDFSRSVSPDSVGSFELAADFHTNADTPRVPWANEPGCGSCHTGSATNNLANSAGVLKNPTDSNGNLDGIRLLQAYRLGDSKATPIVPTNGLFAENIVTADDNPDAAGNPKLYRISTGHGGLFCEACHGATHAEWPNANPNANDNVAANQLQGHTGTVTECTVCHSGSFDIEDFKNAMSQQGIMEGPHGMHPVNDAMWNEKHKEVSNLSKNSCRACHGQNGEGTVLSRAAEDRVLRCKNTELPGCDSRERIQVSKGAIIGCALCHANQL